MKRKRKKYNKIFSLVMLFVMVLSMNGCGGNNAEGSTGTSAETLGEVNEIPEDGIITKEQFKTVAGEEKQIQFIGETEDGISYIWTYDAAQIQNPEDQNLKIDFSTENLDEIKAQANDANDAIKLTMYGKGLICVPTLTITVPKTWQSNTGLLLKEQGGNLARMSDVTIDSQTTEGATVLTMSVTSLDGDCYVVGGVTEEQNKGAAAANAAAKSTDKSGQTAAGDSSATTASGQTGTNQSGTTSSGSSSQAAATTDSSGGGEDVANDVEAEQASHTCTISISCATILNNMDNLTSGKEEFVPADGIILAASTVEFEEGDSVHDVLKQVCKDAGIHMESSYTPAYNSAYVEGINQLYEFDCGELSGWMYKVNGWFPNYGCSKYTVSDGDVIDWVYTCDLGEDVGDNSMY
ncbi:MAG: DUF4430 domain-containing protein [Lachnospiraceae bacterium]|nr:DUF4430 domain-containing protein [Lachnospiraceae bacterium]